MGLTLWYTIVLGLVLILLAVQTYFLYWHHSVRRTDGNIIELSEAFITTLNAELADETVPELSEECSTRIHARASISWDLLCACGPYRRGDSGSLIFP